MDLSVSAAQSRADSRKSSMKGANLVSRTSEMMNRNKD